MALPEHKYLQSDYAQRKLAEVQAREQSAPTPPVAPLPPRLSGRALDAAVLRAIRDGHTGWDAIYAEVFGRRPEQDEAMAVCTLRLWQKGFIKVRHTGREIHSWSAGGKVLERFYWVTEKGRKETEHG